MPAKSRKNHNKHRIHWQWNIPLLIRSLCIVVGLGIVTTALYFWQSSSMAAELLAQAKNSGERGENKEQVKWLSRYVRLVPNDVENLAKLAFAVDAQETGPKQNVEFARSRLSAALVACGEEPNFEELRRSLRRKLIPRLLQYGSTKAPEAEDQIQLLSATENDAEVIKWLAKSLLLQRVVSEYQARDPNQYEKEADFGKWLASQPTGQVLRIAVEANPNDVETIQNLLIVCTQQPSWFSGKGESVPKQQIEELARQSVERLSVMKDDGHAQVAVYSYLALSDPTKAKTILLEAVEPALARLSEFISSRAGSNSNLHNVADPSAGKSRLSGDYETKWDWQIGLVGCSLEGVDSQGICERLVKLAKEEVSAEVVPESLRVDAFLRLASIKLKKNEYVDVIDICKSGLSIIPKNASLNQLTAFANLKLEKVEEAVKAIEEIKSDTEVRLRQLDGDFGIGMSSSQKAAIRLQIGIEQWNAQLLRGQLALVQKDYVKATKLVRDAYKTTMSVEPENRAEAGMLLAKCYSLTDQWDLAGQVFDELSTMRPNDQSISLQAVYAWQRAGSPERAGEKLVRMDDRSYSTSIARAVLLSSRPAFQDDKRAVLDALKIARRQLDEIPEAERSSLEPWRLELLELRYGYEDAKSPKEQQDSLDKLETIAARYPDVSEVQSQAAFDLAAFGRLESSGLAISRLEQKAASAQPAADERANLVVTKASILVFQKDTEGALKLFDEAINSMPQHALKLAKVGSQIAIRENRIDKAYALMSSIPEKDLDFEAIVMFAGIADSLKDADTAKSDELAIKLEGWINRLKQSEGDDGTNWRYLAAERLIVNQSKGLNSSPALDQAARYFKEIDAIRPHWGLSAALGARVASRTGASEDAIALWRRAIRDGDIRVSTVLDLVRELRLVGRFDQAEAEWKRVSGLADSVVPISALAVSFAIKRGAFSEALLRAEQLTIRKPEEVEGWLLRAQTTFAASSAVGLDEVSQSKLRDDSWAFLEKAHSISLGKSIGVWDARFRFKLLTGDKAGASTLLEEMLKETSLTEEVRFIEAGRRYLTLKEYGLARRCFDNCLLINPSSADVYLGLADLNAAIGDTEESLNSLRKAHKAAPKNQLIRDRLAINLAFSRNEKTEEIDWKEIDALFTSTALPTTTRSTLVGALIALRRGEKERQTRAIKTLRELSQSSTPERNDAKRLLANYFAVQWSVNVNGNQSQSAIEAFESARRLYEELLDETNTNPTDAARYGSLLLSYDAKAKESKLDTGVDYLTIVERALTKLESATGSSIASLQLRIRLAKARGEEATIGSIAEEWVEGAGDLESLGMQNLWEITGQTLMELGHPGESIIWLERVYEKDPKMYGLLAIALAKEQNYERAFEICVQAYHSEPSPIAATLIAEVAMLQTDMNLREDASQVLKEALTKFADSAELLEAMGTLKLLQRRLPEAVSFYETAEKKDPKRRRTLNNLAMALSEMPMRKQDALARIEKAIEIHGRDPDLLDTLGQVQFRNGQLQEALDTLREACDRKDDVSFRIHLAQVLMVKKDLAGAKEQWERVKQFKLDGVMLTPEEKQFLKDLNSEFGEKL